MIEEYPIKSTISPSGAKALVIFRGDSVRAKARTLQLKSVPFKGEVYAAIR